jgi:hypothetical protein
MAWFAEKGFRLLVVQELTKTQPDYSADLLSSDGERRGGYKSGTGAVKSSGRSCAQRTKALRRRAVKAPLEIGW